MRNQNDDLLDRARHVIRELREKLAAAEARNFSEPIAIGMAAGFLVRVRIWRLSGK